MRKNGNKLFPNSKVKNDCSISIQEWHLCITDPFTLFSFKVIQELIIFTNCLIIFIIELMKQTIKKFYLFGNNIETSLSPKIHTLLFQIKQKNGFQYILANSIAPNPSIAFNNQLFGGATLTIPYKKYLSSFPNQIRYQGNFAKFSNTINTVIKNQTNNNLIGYNTDIYAVKMLMDPFVKKLGKKRSVYILGAGATSQTFCWYFTQQQMISQIFISNRSNERVKGLKNAYEKVKYIEQAGEETNPCSMIINTVPTSVIKDKFPIQFLQKALSYHIKGDEMVYMDVNYRDKDREIQKYLEQRIVNFEQIYGIDMLIWQAIEQNRIFCGEQYLGVQQKVKQFDMIKQGIKK